MSVPTTKHGMIVSMKRTSCHGANADCCDNSSMAAFFSSTERAEDAKKRVQLQQDPVRRGTARVRMEESSTMFILNNGVKESNGSTGVVSL